MGIFFEAKPVRPAVREAIRDAIITDHATVENLDAEANARADSVANELLGGAAFNTGRFLIAAAIFLAIVVAAIISEAADLDESNEALFGLATTIFGVVVGFLGGEKSSTGT